MTKERKLWLIVQDILDNHGDYVDDISIHESTGYWQDEGFKIYVSAGYCWEIGREEMCAAEEVLNYEGVDEDGWSYSFSEPWEEFKESGIDKAIEILGAYGLAEVS